MPVINYATGEVEIKVVYYGPPFAGKTTNLRAILSLLQEEPSALKTLRTGPDETLFFEITLPSPVLIEGFTNRVRLWTVPGEPQSNAARQLVLRDVDGVIFVVDPAWRRVRENVQALENLESNLRRNQIQLEEVPLVFQYNKSDLPGSSRRDYLDFVLNRGNVRRRPVLEASALREEEVIPCLERVLEQVVAKFWRKREAAAGKV